MKFLKIVCAVSIAIVIILASFFFLLFNSHFYSYEFKKQDISSSELSNSQYVSYTGQIVRYFFRKGTLYITDKNGNVIENFFSKREIIHMQDVKNIIKLTLFVLFSSFIISFIFILYLEDKRFIFRYASIGALIFVLLTVVLVTLNFDSTFTLFHKILFRNNFWLLPENSMLIQMFPESFFSDFALSWFGIISVVSAIVVFFSYLHK